MLNLYLGLNVPVFPHANAARSLQPQSEIRLNYWILENKPRVVRAACCCCGRVVPTVTDLSTRAGHLGLASGGQTPSAAKRSSSSNWTTNTAINSSMITTSVVLAKTKRVVRLLRGVSYTKKWGTATNWGEDDKFAEDPVSKHRVSLFTLINSVSFSSVTFRSIFISVLDEFIST